MDDGIVVMDGLEFFGGRDILFAHGWFELSCGPVESQDGEAQAEGDASERVETGSFPFPVGLVHLLLRDHLRQRRPY